MMNPANSIKKLYYSIGEVSKVAELKQYVLRYWETEFKQLNPSKNKAGNRTYRQKDIDLILKNIITNNDYLMIKGSNATGLKNISNSMIRES